MASTSTAPLVQLRSPFNGELLTVPPDWAPSFVEALVKRGFTRVEAPATRGVTRDEAPVEQPATTRKRKRTDG